jgi:hypothetical protein
MPIFDFVCPDCDIALKNYCVRKTLPKCSRCGKYMCKAFPLSVHTKIGSVVDSKDVGKRIKEKNDRLKKRESGYAHEEQNLRKKMNKMVEEKMREK